jgi:hypothetical protein
MGMENGISVESCAKQIVQQVRQCCMAESFCLRHRRQLQDFTRQRRLTFPALMFFLLTKSLKSLQVRLHEFAEQWAQWMELPVVTAGALTHARTKLKASAFVELNEVAVLTNFYGAANSPNLKHWRGHRLLGVDSSLMRLPESQELAQRYPTSSFGELYGHRWGIETYYGRLKGRLDLEHFSGKTVEAVEQDFAAMVFLSNLERVIELTVEERLSQATQQRQQRVQVNRAVSFHALKFKMIELLASERPIDEVIRQLQDWMIQNPVSVRTHRKIPRRKFYPLRSYHFQRYVRKIVF